MKKVNGIKSKVRLSVFVEDGCNPEEEEYSLEITGLIGTINITGVGGECDIDLIKECFEEDCKEHVKECGIYYFDLIESGEQQDVFFNKFYELESWEFCQL